MPKMRARWSRGIKTPVVILAIAAMLAGAATAEASCRVTDFTDRTLSSLNEAERLSFVSQMTQTEFDKLHAAPADGANYDPIIAASASVTEARQAALAKFAGLGVENIDDYRRIWASDYLTDEQLQRYTNCTSGRQPGLTVAGRSESPANFHLTFTHVTPIGVEKITTRLVASYNIANIKEFESFLTALGPRDNYTAQTFALQLEDPTKRAVLVMRAGWETPKFVYIPVYPTADYFK
jgi:hypothetical protein